MLNHITTQMQTLNTNPKMNVTTVKHLQSIQTIATHHMRHIFMPIDQTNKKLFISCNNLWFATIQSHSSKRGCCKPNEKYLIVATINPISHSCPVHHGTFSNILIHKFVGCKCREITFFAHKYFRKQKTNKASLCLILQLNLFFSKRRLGI